MTLINQSFIFYNIIKNKYKYIVFVFKICYIYLNYFEKLQL